MRTIVLYKGSDRNGHYFWTFEDMGKVFTNLEFQPYEIRLPDDMSPGLSEAGRKVFIKDGSNACYELFSMNTRNPNSQPFIIGGTPMERIYLDVVRQVNNP